MDLRQINPRFYSLWAINDKLQAPRLRRQLDHFRALGLDGVVFHPRFYPNDPPYLGERYLAELSEAILYAQSLGLAFWIYDEDGWPSGTVGGQLLKQYPADAQRWAELVSDKPQRCLAEFEHDGKRWFLAERIGAGVDYLNPNLARHFLELTHERYRAGLKPEAWQHVEAIFCDEPEFGLGHAFDSLSRYGAIPWTPRLPELFRARYGQDLLALMPQILFSGNDGAEGRVKFWELLTDLFNESFLAPLNDWCARHGKLFTAHVKGEEHPLFQVPTSGSCHQVFRHLALPGIDALERFPANNFYPRQVSSAARQFGNGRCMAEAFGGAGWGASPENLERYLLWLGRHGLTDFVLHLSQYRLDSAAIRDWPPSQPLHLTWSHLYKEVLARVRRELESPPRPAADTLVVAPYRGIMAHYEPWEFLHTNVHNARAYPDTAAGKINRHFMERVEVLHRAGGEFDVTDERTLEQAGKVEDGCLFLGNCVYQRLLVDEACRFGAGIAGSLLNTLPQQTASVLWTEVNRLSEFHALSTAAPSPSKGEEAERGVIPVQWTLEEHPLNSLLLETASENDDWFSASFACTALLPNAALELVFADDIAALTLNDVPLPLAPSGDGSLAKCVESLVRSQNVLRFRAARRVQDPFVWLQGLFRVISAAPFTEGPRETLRTDGPFKLHPSSTEVERDLIRDGFAFLRRPLLAAATVELAGNIRALRLEGAEADAVRLRVDHLDLGWTWQKEHEGWFDAKVSGGVHRLRLELVPNSFNTFGPHHYYGGDWPVISSAQMGGARNFADADDAPANTHVKAWHFRRFKLPGSLSVVMARACRCL